MAEATTASTQQPIFKAEINYVQNLEKTKVSDIYGVEAGKADAVRAFSISWGVSKAIQLPNDEFRSSASSSFRPWPPYFALS